MGFCLCHVKMIICNQSFFTDFAFVCSEKGDTRKMYPVIDSPIHGKYIEFQLCMTFCTIILVSTEFTLF